VAQVVEHFSFGGIPVSPKKKRKKEETPKPKIS
jgi:hypothetical protein